VIARDGAPRPRQPLAIIVMGVSGSGKSTLARRVAESLRAPFFEGDDYHPPANREKMRAGIPLEDSDRWPWLDSLGTALGAAARAQGLAVGACSALKRVYRERLRQHAADEVFFVCLTADAALLDARMAQRPGHFMPPSLLASQLATLEAPDESEGALMLDAALSMEELLARTLGSLEGRIGSPISAVRR
jgi:gluconokinase